MLKNKILEKVIVMALVFTLTFANSALTTKVLATSLADIVFGTSSDTGHKNVRFEAFFETEEQTSVISDVNNKNLELNFKLGVEKTGYLKNTQIEILEAYENQGINYKIKDDLELSEKIESLEDNILKLKQINNSSEVNISIPIEYKNEEYVNENKFNQDSKIIFTGIYVDEKGNDIEVSKEIILNVSWKDNREVNIETEITKYIGYGMESSSGIILQTLVKVDSETDENSLPVKETELNIKAPTIDGKTPSNITVIANSTSGTNGKSAEDVTFGFNNWNFNKDENTLTIKTQNEKELVKVDEYKDEYLKDADKEITQEERFYSLSGADEYLITYTFESTTIEDEFDIEIKADAKLTTFSGVTGDDSININNSSKTDGYTLNGETGDIVSFNIENKTEEVSKIYTYLNYNSDNKHEVEYNTKTILNIVYKEIVKEIIIQDLENQYIDKSGNITTQNDIYYKEISIDKFSFENILGEDGYVQVLDEQGNAIALIDKDFNSNEENFVLILNEKYSKLNLKTSEPVNEGNLIINSKKATTDAGIGKDTYKNLEYIATDVRVMANYEYVENSVEIGTEKIKTKLTDTETKANLKIDRNSFSTLAVNNDVELRIELNNEKEVSDVYENPVFEIEFPSYVKNVDVTNVSTIYSEEFELAKAETYLKGDKQVLRIELSGKQSEINTGVITNGTNIVINANIKLDVYTPAMEDKIELYYKNDGATNYTDGENGYEYITINYSAPIGFIAVNSTSNYNNSASVLASVKQGKKIDTIEIYAEAKRATMEIIVMNNNENTVTNLSILGRIPFKGVKDIATGESLGTTLNTKMINGIAQDGKNIGAVTIYYSENENAGKDLRDDSNGWTMNYEGIDVKSYLIVPVDPNYEMQKAEILRFTYEYEIPANLEHNHEIYGTFLAYYTNNAEEAITEETAKPDIIGLTTGEGPELTLEVSTNVSEIRETEELKITAVVENVGNSKVQDIKVNIPVPDYTEFVSVDGDNIYAELNNNIVTFSIGELEINASATVALNVLVNQFPSPEEYYKNIKGFMQLEDGTYIIRHYETEDFLEDEHNGAYEDEIITSVSQIMLDIKASVSAAYLAKEIEASANKVKVIQAEFSIREHGYELELEGLENYQDFIHPQGVEIPLTITVRNLTSEAKQNVTVTKVLPEEFGFVEAYMIGFSEDEITEVKIENATYNQRTVTWNVGSLSSDEYKVLRLIVKLNNLPEGKTKITTHTSSKVTGDGTDTYESNTVRVIIGKSSLNITQTSNTNTYVTEGNTINYIFTIKNEGTVAAESITFKDIIPAGLTVKKLTYTVNGITSVKNVSSSAVPTINSSIQPGEEMTINVEVLAKSLKGVQELSVTNFGTLSAPNMEEIKTNSITHIIEADPNSATNKPVDSSNSANYGGNTSGNNLAKTYKITGVAWLDENRNGQIDSNEELMSGIVARLVNAETGVIQKTVTTDSKGEYSFNGVENGNYLVIFDYDTVRYSLTAYQKDGVEPYMNSKAITTKIEQDGKQRNGAVTDTIIVKDSSVQNINIGLVYADTFDLKLDKTITKLTTQSRAGTVNTSYNKVALAKTEIGAKYLSGATLYVEYTISVTNIGDLTGKATKIVDYIPEGMTFSSSLNPNWYTGTDGNLYTTALAEEEIRVGETKEIKLVLTRQMTENNTGLINNTAEIYEDYNIYGITDKDAKNNKNSADTIISVKTGEVFIYISVIITTILLGSVVIFMAYTRIVISKRKGGV